MNPEDIRVIMDMDPFALAGRYLFLGGMVGLYTLCLTRQNMSCIDAAKAIVGLKPVRDRDWFLICYILD